MGHILAEDGTKMSKSRGNSVTPDEAIAIYGADAILSLFHASLEFNAVWRQFNSRIF